MPALQSRGLAKAPASEPQSSQTAHDYGVRAGVDKVLIAARFTMTSVEQCPGLRP